MGWNRSTYGQAMASEKKPGEVFEWELPCTPAVSVPAWTWHRVFWGKGLGKIQKFLVDLEPNVKMA